MVEAPWLHGVEPRGPDASVVLATEHGTTRIEGETILSTCHDGETANGMLERSSVADEPA